LIKIESIDKSLLDANSIVTDRNFVGIATYIDDTGYAYHSGLIIKYEDKALLFHYTSVEVATITLPHRGQKIVCKNLDFIIEDEVRAFYVHCSQIQQNAKPSFGFFYAGDYYDKNGNYFSASSMQEYMTCVGFCISVVTGYIEGHDYFVHDDWDEGAYTDIHFESPEDYFEVFLAQVKKGNPNVEIDEKLFRKNLRRITPTEYTASGFVSKPPIRKAQLTPILPPLQKVLAQRAPALRSGS
jgi:hypothetical protein